ncbi:F-box protein At5g52880-like isoform X2 [Raphanus sativus]|uniref:F-box protein At5g52880-like isoform X2 n=1 Tax=Raphanus sativus TaxID=3726 RepID=A0A6J0L3C3_RAPSA|nr:F-box protein At5g52880-like isoform X2 [Raphanus sativus]
MNMMRYQNLMVGDGLSDHHLYSFACNELSSMIDLGYSRLPKDVRVFIFRDCLSAFRLLPDMNTSAAISAANLLLKSVESAFPKQKKNVALVQFKQAKVALKRRTKSHDEHIITPSLPQDILIHIFSLLDVSSLLSSSQVSRSWNLATHEGSLWRSLFDLHFSHEVMNDIHPGFDWREAFKNECIVYNSSKMLRSGRGYCSYCETVVWHDNFRCPKKQCQFESGKEQLDPMLTRQVVNYLLGITISSDESDSAESGSVESSSVESDSVESDSDDEAVPGLWANPKKHTERIPML